MWLAIGTLLGGLGLFLLAVSMITDGMKVAAGARLRAVLANSTRTRLRGVASGAALTAAVQSSSAVTVATIGFVNAGLLGLSQALGIVLGATIGTTITGWLVSAVGFKFSITAFALPLVGVGMIARLVGPSRRLGAIGEAIAGFGLFFIGVDFLRMAFEGLAEGLDVGALAPEGVLGSLMYIGVGFLMTLLTQSSSAAIAITLTAATGGVIGMPAALAMVIGATIGTTSTSALAVIGATPNAKRVAAGHVMINSFSSVVGLCLLPLVLMLMGALGGWKAFGGSAAPWLALFHTSFTLIGALLLWHLVPRMAAWLEQRFRSQAETLGQAQYLDANVMASPGLALDAFLLELQRMAEISRTLSRAVISAEPGSMAVAAQRDGLRRLSGAVEQAVGALEAERLGAEVSQQLPLVLRVSNYVDELVTLTEEAAAETGGLDTLLTSPVGGQIASFQADLLALIAHADPLQPEFSADAVQLAYEHLHRDWRALKSTLLDAGVRREVQVRALNPAIETLRARLRMAERSVKIATRLAELARAVPALESTPEPAGNGSNDGGTPGTVG